MAEISTVGVVGTDSITPVYDPNSRWCWWSIKEIYLGKEGKSKYIPKVGDYVIDPDTYTTYMVMHLDLVTLIPSLVEKRPANVNMIFTEEDILFGPSVDTYRLYIDDTVIPHSIAVDARLKVAGSMVKFCKIFRGNDLGDNGEVISRVYNSSNQFLGNTVELELVAFNTHDNHAIKSVPVCSTLTKLRDGEIVTVVFYDDKGHVVSKRQLLVENTSFIRQAFDEEKYIIGIDIESPFKSPTLPDLIEFPLNVPLNDLNIYGIVSYSDGSHIKLPVDGSKFSVFGLEQYVSSIIGQKIELALSYRVSNTESVYGATIGDGKYITHPFNLITIEPNNAYTVKVYGFPEFMNVYEGYSMRWFLLDLDRTTFKDVTPYVRFAENTGVFNKLGYGSIQSKSITLKLSDISGAYRDFIHTQHFNILLRGEPNMFDTPWEISLNNSGTLYGNGLKVVRDFNNKRKFTIDNGLNVLDDWLSHTYYKTFPLLNSYIETQAPTPTHFEVSYANKSRRYSITEYKNYLDIGIEIPIHSNVYIKFLKETISGDLILSMAGMIVKN